MTSEKTDLEIAQWRLVAVDIALWLHCSRVAVVQHIGLALLGWSCAGADFGRGAVRGEGAPF